MQPFRCARNGRRTKAGDAVLRQPRRHIGNGIRTIEHVSAFEAMHVHIDEAGDDGVTADIDHGRSRTRAGEAIDALDDAVNDGEGTAGDDLIRQDDVRAGEDDHASRAAARAAPIATASLPSVETTMRISAACRGCRRRKHSARIGSSSTSAACAMRPPRTIVSGSNSVAMLAAAAPTYFAVSRVTDIDTPSPARPPSRISAAVSFEKSPFTLSATAD